MCAYACACVCGLVRMCMHVCMTMGMYVYGDVYVYVLVLRGCSNTVGSGTVGFSFSVKPYRFLRWSKNHLLQACFWGWTTKAQAHIGLGPHRTRTTDRTRPRRPSSQDRPGPEGQAHTGAGPKRNSQPPPAGPNRIRATLQNAKHSSKNNSRKEPPQKSRKISEIAPKTVSRRTPNRTPTVFEQPRKLETFEKNEISRSPKKRPRGASKFSQIRTQMRSQEKARGGAQHTFLLADEAIATSSMSLPKWLGQGSLTDTGSRPTRIKFDIQCRGAIRVSWHLKILVASAQVA